jgi:hypothetical protein
MARPTRARLAGQSLPSITGRRSRERLDSPELMTSRCASDGVSALRAGAAGRQPLAGQLSGGWRSAAFRAELAPIQQRPRLLSRFGGAGRVGVRCRRGPRQGRSHAALRIAGWRAAPPEWSAPGPAAELKRRVRSGSGSQGISGYLSSAWKRGSSRIGSQIGSSRRLCADRKEGPLSRRCRSAMAPAASPACARMAA